MNCLLQKKLFSIYIFPPFFFINKYILLMKTASETFIEHLTAVVRTGVTAVLAIFGDHQLQRSIQPEGGCTAGFCPKFLLTCQGWCPSCKGMALITNPSQASVFVQFPVTALMRLFQPAWPEGEVCPSPGTWRSSLCFFQCCWISVTPLRPQHHCNPHDYSDLSHKAAP